MNTRFTAETSCGRCTCVRNEDLLSNPKTALFCSRKCPAGKILDAVELFKQWAKEGKTVISGFHSPVEQQCLKLFLASSANIIVCPARGIQNMRIPSAWKPALEERRMLIISPFDAKIKRSTAATCKERNDFIADLADEIVVIHAAPGSQLHALKSKGSHHDSTT